MPYRVIAADISTGEDSALCYTLTQAEAEELIVYLAQQGPDLRFAIVPDEDDN